MDIWSILDIEETKDKEKIQAAYRSRLAVTNPEDDPQAFMDLRKALEEAILKADEKETEGEDGAAKVWGDGPVGSFLCRVDAVYSHFSQRIDPKVWQQLLQDPVCQNLDTRTEARDALLEYMMEHFYLPQQVTRVLDQHFDLVENMEELQESFPKGFLEIVITQSIEQQEYPPYAYLFGDDSLPFDTYLKLSSQLNRSLDEGDTGRSRELLKQMEATGIRSPYLQIEEAKICCQEEKYDEAERLMQGLSSEYGDLEDVQLMRGDINFFLGRHEAAREEYSLALEKDPHSAWGRTGLAKCYVKSGKYKEASEILCQLLQEDPYDMGAGDWLTQCNDLLIEDLEKTIEEDRQAGKTPDQEQIFDLGWALFQNEKYQQVQELLADISPEENYRIQYSSLLGRSCLYSGREDEALEHLLVWERCLGALADTEENRKKKTEQIPYVLQLQSTVYEHRGEREKALELLDRQLLINPRDADGLRQKGQVLYNMWDFEGAVDALTASIEADRDMHISYLLRAKALFRMDYLGEAFEDCEYALELYPYELASYVWKIKILLAAEELDAAKETIEHLLREEVAGTELDFLRACIAEAEGRDEEARKAFLAVIDRKGMEKKEEFFNVENLSEVYHHLAVMEYDEADEDFTPVVELIDKGLAEDGAYIPLLEMKALIAHECGLHQEALELYEKIRRLAPGKLGTCGMIDEIYREMEQWDKALEYAQLQLEQTPSGYAYMRRGQLFTCLDRFEEAWEDFSTAVELDPDLEYVYNYMGVILEYRGQEEEALENYSKAIEVGEAQEEICDEAYSNAATLYCRRSDYDQAARVLQRAWKKTEDPQFLYQKIAVFRMAGDFSQAREALAAYGQAEGLSKRDPFYCLELANIYRDEGQESQALKLYEKAERSEPWACKEIGKILYYKGRCRKAIEYFIKGIELLKKEWDHREPELLDMADYYLWAARTYQKLKRHKDAAFFAHAGMKLLPEEYQQSMDHCQPLVYQTIGALHVVAGDLDSGRAWIGKAAELKKCDDCNYKRCIEALFEMGYLCEVAGEPERAMDYYRQGLEAAPVDRDLVRAAASLE